MSNEPVNVEQFDEWLKDDSDVAALVMRQWLEPVEGKEAIIFPPTYAKPEGMRDADWPGYNIDSLADGSKVCLIDSVGSQANRMEPIFKRAKYKHLVPQIVIKAGQKAGQIEVNLLDAGHRAADAFVRFSTLGPPLHDAFLAYQRDGNAEPMARIAPTSIVFGSWDSRATQSKLPRLVRSVIRAFRVETLHRSAQYITPIDYIGEGLLDKPEGKTHQQHSMSELGFSHAPRAWTHGGVLARDGIRRDMTLNLVGLRNLGAAKDDNARDLLLRRYILGLSLVTLTAPQESFLREGCLLVPDAERPAEWRLVRHDGKREPFGLAHREALDYAETVAQSFGVGEAREATFSAENARKELGQTREQRRTARRASNRQTEEVREE